MQMLSEDTRNLKKGLEELKFEREKDPDNFIVFISSHTHTVHAACKEIVLQPWQSIASSGAHAHYRQTQVVIIMLRTFATFVCTYLQYVPNKVKVLMGF